MRFIRVLIQFLFVQSNDLAALPSCANLICFLREVTLRSFDTVGLHNSCRSAVIKLAERDCKCLYLFFFRRELSAIHSLRKTALWALHSVEKSGTDPTLS